MFYSSNGLFSNKSTDSLWLLNFRTEPCALKSFLKFESELHYDELFIKENVCVLLGTEAEDEDGRDENGHRRTPEAEQWDVLADGRDGGVDLQVRQVSRPLLGAAAWVGAHALRHVAVERVGVARLLYVITRWHLSEEYEHGLN